MIRERRPLLPLLRQHRWYFVPVLLWWLVMGGLIFQHSSVGLFRAVNQVHHPWADLVLSYLTHVGDGLFFAGIIVLFLAMKRWWAAGIAGIAYASSGLLTQALKRLVFPHELRPKAYFESINEKIRLIDGLEIFGHNSFPSGHSTSVFALATILVLLLGHYRQGRGGAPLAGLAWALGAMLVSFTRVYLAQHFPSDILAGSVIGVVCSIICYYLLHTHLPAHNGTNTLSAASRQGHSPRGGAA